MASESSHTSGAARIVSSTTATPPADSSVEAIFPVDVCPRREGRKRDPAETPTASAG